MARDNVSLLVNTMYKLKEAELKEEKERQKQAIKDVEERRKKEIQNALIRKIISEGGRYTDEGVWQEITGGRKQAEFGILGEGRFPHEFEKELSEKYPEGQGGGGGTNLLDHAGQFLQNRIGSILPGGGGPPDIREFLAQKIRGGQPPGAPPVSAPAVAGQFTGGQQQSPYPDYPDAFQEDGVWKVMRNGKKYRIET